MIDWCGQERRPGGPEPSWKNPSGASGEDLLATEMKRLHSFVGRAACFSSSWGRLCWGGHTRRLQTNFQPLSWQTNKHHERAQRFHSSLHSHGCLFKCVSRTDLAAVLGVGINTPKSLSLDTYPFVCSCQEKLDLEKLQWLLKAFLKNCASLLPPEPLDSLSLAAFFFVRLWNIQIFFSSSA